MEEFYALRDYSSCAAQLSSHMSPIGRGKQVKGFLIAFECLCLLIAEPTLIYSARNLPKTGTGKEVFTNADVVRLLKIGLKNPAIAEKIRGSDADFNTRTEELRRLKSDGVSGAVIALKSKTRPVPKGTWGGEHVGLSVEDDRARLEYDCAYGTIDRAMKVDSRGRFNLTGTHTLESGGPATGGEKPNRHPALYTGQVTGERMVITITLTDTKETVGTFTLVRSKQPNLYKCK